MLKVTRGSMNFGCRPAHLLDLKVLQRRERSRRCEPCVLCCCHTSFGTTVKSTINLNKLEELNLVICDQESKPHVIVVTESKPKKYSGNIAASEFNVKGYNVFFEGEHDNSRGITVYVRDDLSATQMDEGLPFHEHLLLKLNTDKQDGFILGSFYRSPTSPPENDKELFTMISYLNNKYYEKMVIVGDFNFATINWTGWTASGNDKNSDELFLDTLRKKWANAACR